jgi:hypothetical protein
MLASAVTFWRWLSGQHFALSAVPDTEKPVTERRVWLRHATKLNIRCEQINDEPDGGVLATITELSRGGIQITAARRFEPGALISVELPSVHGEKGLAVMACVVRAQPHGESDWVMGCRFAGELSDDLLQAFGAARSRPTAPDPRSWSRFPCSVKAFYQRVNGPDQAHHAARVLNIATGGIALLTEEPIALGELLSTALHDPKDQPLVSILACVVHVQALDGGQLVGCNFIRELSDEEMRALI